MRTHWVMDYETLKNCFIGVFEDVKSEHQEIFVCHKSKNDIVDLIHFLKRNQSLNEWHISFNGLAFDSQITEHILRNEDQLIYGFGNGDEIARWIYGKAQETIQRSNDREFAMFSPKDLSIRQIDIFKLNHWDNPAKRSSLKWIQYTMDWKNIIDMPIHHTSEVESSQIPEIIRYCINDVKSTKKIMHLSKEQINLRKALTEEYDIDLFSASEPRISKELFLHFLSKETGIKKYDLKQMRTQRDQIIFKDIILPYIEFKTATFQNLLKKFQEVILYPGETKGGFKYSVQYKGVKTDYGLGGIHGARSSKVYNSSDDMIIMSSDVVSFYPNLAIRNNWAPAHLPKQEFSQLYEWFFEERKKIPKSDPKNYVYKIILNSTYGLSNDENSFLYDPQFTMSITINGQLSLSMLYEMICEEIPGAVPLMQNTDGLETMIPREYEAQYMDICARWEKMTNLLLEHDKYSKIVLGDVNNYIAVNEAGKSKCKGRFEYKDLALHKNKSFLVIPKALHAYFVEGVKPEKFIKENLNIFDFCGGVKIKGDWKFIEHKVTNGLYEEQSLQHTIRYYVSKTGSKIIKKNNSDRREIQVEAGKWMQSLMIDYVEKPFEEYDINYDYYLEKIRKEINSLEPFSNQLSLF
jgi:hypothetical protein